MYEQGEIFAINAINNDNVVYCQEEDNQAKLNARKCTYKAYARKTCN